MKVSSRASSGLSPKRVVCVTNAIDSDSNVDRLGTESTSSINGKDVNYPSVSQVYFIHRRTNSDVGKKMPSESCRPRVTNTQNLTPRPKYPLRTSNENMIWANPVFCDNWSVQLHATHFQVHCLGFDVLAMSNLSNQHTNNSKGVNI
jgi:hypothetical protein